MYTSKRNRNQQRLVANCMASKLQVQRFKPQRPNIKPKTKIVVRSSNYYSASRPVVALIMLTILTDYNWWCRSLLVFILN